MRSSNDTTRRTFLGAVTGSVLGVSTASGIVSAGQETETTTEDANETTQETDGTTFRVRIENVSSPDTLQPSDGSSQSVPISPGVYAVFSTPNTIEVDSPFFTPGSPVRNNGLEALAEAGDPSTLTQNVSELSHVSSSGAFDTPAGADESGPADAGDAYEFTFDASPGEEFTFGTMFIPSNDLFFAPIADGIPLFYDLDDEPKPLSADVTDEVTLWDAGTEENEEPGVGQNQPPRQSGPGAGQSEGQDTPVRFISGVDDGYTYPDTTEVIRVMIWPDDL